MNKQEFDTWYSQNFDKLKSYLLAVRNGSQAVSADDINDIIQNTYMLVIERRVYDRWTCEEHGVNYFKKSLRQNLYQQSQLNSRHCELNDGTIMADIDGNPVGDDLIDAKRRLRQILNSDASDANVTTLTAREKAVIRLFIDGAPQESIASALHVTQSAISKIIAIAVKKLKSELCD